MGEPKLPVLRDHSRTLGELSPKEQQVYDLLVTTMSTEDIHKTLNISIDTLRRHSFNIYNKLGQGSRLELVVNHFHQTITDLKAQIVELERK